MFPWLLRADNRPHRVRTVNRGAFSVAGLIEWQMGADRIESFTCLGTRNPRHAVAMMLFLFSLVGLPPLAGFAVK